MEVIASLKSSLTSKKHCIVLLSGGVDSAACVDFYLRQQFTVHGLHVSYGQPSTRQEISAATAISNHYEIPLTLLKVVGTRFKMDGEILGRNAFLVFIALMKVKTDSTIIALGIHSGTPYYDCSLSFLSTVQEIVDGQCSGRIRVAAPFIKWNKRGIWDYCLAHRVPIELTYSCERGLKQPCGKCLSCQDLEVLHAKKKFKH